MKIAMICMTRENPMGLLTALHALKSLSSGEHEIIYNVRVDLDDRQALDALSWYRSIGNDVAMTLGARPITLGQAWNESVPEGEWDALGIICDDVIPLMPHWDRAIHQLIVDRGFHGFAWMEANDPTNVTYPILSRRYYEAQGRIFPTWFPFWFADTWLSQVYELAKGEPFTLVKDMQLGGVRGHTAGMRDLGFWVDFWRATRPLRVQEAQIVRDKMGWPEIDIIPILTKFTRLDWQWNVAAIEEARGANQGDAPERYLIAKERALRWLEENPGILKAGLDHEAA